MKILVTGATGFVGSHLCKKLLHLGHYVYGVSKTGKTDNIIDFKDEPNFSLIIQDLLKIDHLLFPNNIDIIFHLASQQPSLTYLTFDDFLKGNLILTRKIADYYTHSNVKFIVYSSSVSIYGLNESLLEETTPSIYPLTDYALTKKWGEELLKNQSRKLNKGLVIFRYPSIFGIGHNDGFVYNIVNAAKNDEDILIYDEGKKYRNIIHIDDVIDANISLLNKEKMQNFEHETYLLGSKDTWKMMDIAKHIVLKIRSNSKIILTNRETFNSLVNIDNAINKIDFSPMDTKTALNKYLFELGVI